MLASPLEKEYGEHMRALSISGAAKVAVQMMLPLGKERGDRHIDGSLELADAMLADSRWDLRFTGVSGRTSFNERGFATENLSVRLQDEPGTFNLRVGDATGDKAVAALATLDGRFSAATLLDRDADLAWLKPWMNGIANWRVAVGVPNAKGARTQPASQLRLNSDLVGVEITMPAPLGKARRNAARAGTAGAAAGGAGEINLRLGQLMRMRARSRKDAPINGAIQFGEGALAAAPAQGLTVRGRVPVLDSTGWVAFSSKGEDSKGAAVHDVDVQADQLIFLDRGFSDARLQLERTAALTHIMLKGKGIDGAVDVPSEAARPVAGQVPSLFLPSEDGTQLAVVAQRAAVEDPSSLPPMHFSIADLRIGQAQLGKAELQTSPMPSGLRIDKFQTQAKDLSMSAAGEWVRSAAGSRSNLRVDFTAASLGQMLDALGYGDMVEGGRTKATLTGSWPGSPGAFSLATLSGSLKAEVGRRAPARRRAGWLGPHPRAAQPRRDPAPAFAGFQRLLQEGFAFNTVKGDFVFADGLARTDNLRIDGPAAEIRVSAARQMRDKLYDQRVEVLPKARRRAAGARLPGRRSRRRRGRRGRAGRVHKAAQADHARGLHVTGPWAKPVVTVIEKGTGESGAPRRTAPAGSYRHGETMSQSLELAQTRLPGARPACRSANSTAPSAACSGRAWISATCISSTAGAKAGRSRTASSRTARMRSSRASACARSAARRPASPIPTTSAPRPCWSRRTPRARSAATAARTPPASASRSPAPAVRATRSDRGHGRGGQGRGAARARRAGARRRPAREAGGGEPVGAIDTVLVARSGRRARRRRASAGALQRAGLRRGERAARVRLRRLRRPLFLRGTVRGRQAGGDRARGAAPGAAQPGAVDAPAGTDAGGARDRAGRACCCTRRSATAWKATSTARAPRVFRTHRPARGRARRHYCR
jgi:hypothetical protein